MNAGPAIVRIETMADSGTIRQYATEELKKY